MITPRSTRLVRVPDLHGMHAAVRQLAAGCDPLDARHHAVLVPTRGAGEALRRTLESLLLGVGPPPDHAIARSRDRVCVLPDLLTRGDLYSRLYQALPEAPPLLSEFEREALFRRAARLATEGGAPAPFRLRPRLIVEILAFYDELRRRHRTISAFDRLITDSLSASVEIDRGAERMMRQTRFLTAAFAEFERAVGESGSIDEHGLRTLLIGSSVSAGLRHLVITVADQAADPLGLWPADYDLIARMPGLERIDVIATEGMLATPLHQRIHDQLPGIQEERMPVEPRVPVLLAPAMDSGSANVCWFTSRDREEELADIAARVKTGESPGDVAVVFQRPLPYLYLAKNVFADAELPYYALDALPLAGEPFAAALDLVFAAALSEATRSSLIELLASPHWRFRMEPDGQELARGDVQALDAFLRQAKYLGGWGRLRSLASEIADSASSERSRRGRRAAPGLRAAIPAADRLAALAEAPTAFDQIHLLLAFIRDHERLPSPADEWHARHLRVRAAVLSALESLACAHRKHDDAPLEVGELAGTVRRWIEGQTFSPRTGQGGVALFDAPAAAYADADEVCLIGLVEPDWPDRHGRNIFYPASLLSQLGWGTESDRLAAARARFNDLLRLARARVSVSTFVLEDDAVVAPSPFLDEVANTGLPIEEVASAPRPRVFLHEALAETPTLPDVLTGPASEWLALRASRNAADGDRFRGFAGARVVPAHAVSHVERYLECPFKYFASHVLRLEEEREDQSGLTPQERGQLLHDVFEQFFRAWHDDGQGAITGANLAAALELFERIADARLSTLPDSDRSLERTYLLGSAVAAGLAERAFAFEIEHGVEVIERLLEHPLEGQFRFEAGGEVRQVNIRAKADRIDMLGDGTLRVIDYKLGRAPKSSRALQLPIYGVCAAQHLDGRRGRHWTVSRAGYVAFRERNAFVALGPSLAEAFEAGQQRFLTAVAAIERGEFPVDPDEPFLCSRCGFAGVCRKDYVGDD